MIKTGYRWEIDGERNCKIFINNLNLMISFTLPGIPPSKKNCKKIICRGRRPMLLSSDSYKKRHQSMREYLPSVDIVNGIAHFKYHFYIPFKKDWTPSKRTRDLSNKCESISDLMVDMWIILDDDYLIISSLNLTREYCEYWKGRVDITITKE